MKKWAIAIFLFMAGCSAQTDRAPLPDDFLVIAHRGASAYAPEHSLYAYELALQMNADYIELDLHMTKDEELVVIHDGYLPTDSGEQAVGKLSFNEVQQIDLYEKEFIEKHPVSLPKEEDLLRIVSLKEVLLHFGDDAKYYIELKTPSSYKGMEEEVVHQLTESGLLPNKDSEANVIIQSFDKESLLKIHQLDESIPLIQLYSYEKGSIPKKEIRALSKYASGVGVPADFVTEEFVRSLHDAGLHVHPFTVNDAEEAQRLIELGVNGIFTDDPAIFLKK